MLYVGVTFGTLFLAAGIVVPGSAKGRLPSEQTARQQFLSHRAGYARLVSLLRQVPGDQTIGDDGKALDHGRTSDLVPEYRELMKEVGAQFAVVGGDRSVEFALWGSGCAICSDSYMGVLYVPAQRGLRGHPGWTPKLVKSLDDSNLPREGGSVADGLYVVQVEPHWFIYRFEYHE